MTPDGIRVLKFGGSSVGDPAVMQRAAMVTTAALSRDGRPGSGPGVVVVSALGGVTRQLVQVADDAIQGNAGEAKRRVHALRVRHAEFVDKLDLSRADTRILHEAVDGRLDELEQVLGAVPSTVPGATGIGPHEVLGRAFGDLVLAFGELLASRLFWGVLRSLGVRCVWIDAREFLRTDDQFGSACPNLERTKELALKTLLPQLQAGSSVVVPGFIGATEDGRSTTMGFEASDLTATVIGAVLEAREVQIWTDVSGVMSADPRVVAEVHPIPHLSYDSAREMALLGARVLHPDTMQPARGANISVRLVNCSRPAEAGTLIDGTASPDESDVVVTSRSGQAVMRMIVSDQSARPVIDALRRVAEQQRVRDVLFAARALSSGIAEVIVVARTQTDLLRLERAAQRFGSTTQQSGVSAISIVACGPTTPEWPNSWNGVVTWDGLTRSRGMLVPDADCEAVVRAVHAQCLVHLHPTGRAGS